MNRLVVDASVAVKWYIPEIHGDEAERILGSGYEMCAPDLLYSEVANVLWKHARRDAITVERAKAIMAALSRVLSRSEDRQSIRSPDVWVLSTLMPGVAKRKEPLEQPPVAHLHRVECHAYRFRTLSVPQRTCLYFCFVTCPP